jgi:TPP-dependent pyruvate/acetoin dehydrogenase alpha subunit
LKERFGIADEALLDVRVNSEKAVEEAIKWASASPHPTEEALLTEVYV